MRKALANIAIAATLVGGGYMVGISTSTPERFTDLPVAEGFLDTNQYTIAVRPNGDNKRETYLQHKELGLELPMTDRTPALLNSYGGNGKYAMEGAIKTVELTRKTGSLIGIDIYQPQAIPEAK